MIENTQRQQQRCIAEDNIAGKVKGERDAAAQKIHESQEAFERQKMFERAAVKDNERIEKPAIKEKQNVEKELKKKARQVANKDGKMKEGPSGLARHGMTHGTNDDDCPFCHRVSSPEDEVEPAGVKLGHPNFDLHQTTSSFRGSNTSKRLSDSSHGERNSRLCSCLSI